MSDGRTLFCRGEEDEADHDDIWDDTELIAAYDRALDLARAELGMTGGTAEDKTIKKWRIGDFCRAVYSEDGLTYEAEILSIGGARCRLRFVGYGNEEDQPLGGLQQSAGKKARRKQEKEAHTERQAMEEAGMEMYEGDGEGVENEEEEAEEEEEDEEEEEAPKVERSKQRTLKKSRKSATQQERGGSVQDSTTAGHSYFGAGKNYHASGQQSWQAGQYPEQSYPGRGPWGAGAEHHRPMAGPRGPHFGPWGPGPGPWGLSHGPWGAAPPFANPWGPPPGSHQGPQIQQGFRGPSDASTSFNPHPPPPPPPPPPPIAGDADPVQLANMLMSWYISGYHTGYYQASREADRAARTGRK